jgi:hypothetical protein
MSPDLYPAEGDTERGLLLCDAHVLVLSYRECAHDVHMARARLEEFG